MKLPISIAENNAVLCLLFYKHAELRQNGRMAKAQVEVTVTRPST